MQLEENETKFCIYCTHIFGARTCIKAQCTNFMPLSERVKVIHSYQCIPLHDLVPRVLGKSAETLIFCLKISL